MALTRIDSYLVDLDSLGGITFDDQAGTPTFKVDATTHRVGIGTASPVTTLDVRGDSYFSGNVGIGTANPGRVLHIKSSGSSVVSDFECDSTFFTSIDLTNTGGYARITSLNNDILLSPAGSEKLRVTSTGNVGIGLTNPDWHLDVLSTNVNAVIRLKSTGSTNGGQLQVNSDDLILRNRDAGDIQLWTNDSNKLTITSTGNVGIGTTNPYTAFHIYKDSNNLLTLDNSSSDTQKIIFAQSGQTHAHIYANSSSGALTIDADPSSNHTSTYINFIIDNGEKARINSSGNIGIGTNNPGTLLDLFRYTGTSGTSDGATLINLRHAVGTGPSSLGDITGLFGQKTFIDFTFTDANINFLPQVRIGAEVGSTSTDLGIASEGNGSFVVYTAQGTDELGNGLLTEKFRVSDSGRVGIGTTNPSQKLTVWGGDVLIDGSSTATLTVGSGSYSGTHSVNVIGGGSNINNGYALNGSLRLFNNTSGTSSTYIAPAAGADIIFANSAGGGELVRIKNAGNVGIGTANPQQKLSIYGNVQINNTGKALYLNAYPGVQDNTVSFEAIRADFTTGASVLEISTKDDTSSLVRRMRVTHLGNVGIGSNITDPTTKLEVFELTTGQRTSIIDTLTIGSDNTPSVVYGGFGQGLVFKGRTYNVSTYRPLARIAHRIWDDSVNTTLGSSLEFQTNDNGSVNAAPTTKLTISYSGNVGVGTADPQAKLHLHEGELRISSSSAYNTHINYLNTGSHYITMANGGSTIFRGSSNGVTSAVIYGGGNVQFNYNVGIGTDSPQTTLHVAQVTDNSGIRLSHRGRALGTYWEHQLSGVNNEAVSWRHFDGTNAFVSYVMSNTYHDWKCSGDTKMYLNSLGNVGIGTTNPIYKLDVLGQLRANSGFSSYTGDGLYGATSTPCVIQTPNAGLMLFGYVSVGDGNYYPRIGTSNNNATEFVDFGAGGANSFTIGTNKIERLRVTSTGNVGIGTTNPSTKLTVNGDILVTDENKIFLNSNADLAINTRNLFGSATYKYIWTLSFDGLPAPYTIVQSSNDYSDFLNTNLALTYVSGTQPSGTVYAYVRITNNTIDILAVRQTSSFDYDDTTVFEISTSTLGSGTQNLQFKILNSNFTRPTTNFLSLGGDTEPANYGYTGNLLKIGNDNFTNLSDVTSLTGIVSVGHSSFNGTLPSAINSNALGNSCFQNARTVNYSVGLGTLIGGFGQTYASSVGIGYQFSLQRNANWDIGIGHETVGESAPRGTTELTYTITSQPTSMPADGTYNNVFFNDKLGTKTYRYNLTIVVSGGAITSTSLGFAFAPKDLPAVNDVMSTTNASFAGMELTVNSVTEIGGGYNVGVGGYTLRFIDGASGNTAIGHAALNNIGTGSYNTALGYNSGSSITTGNYNVVIGSNNGSTIATSSNNIILSDGQGNIRQFIDSSGNVGIGTTNPTEKLHVSGNILFGNNNNGGVYNIVKTISANSSSNVFNLSISNGAVCFTIYCTCSNSGYSVSKIYQVACKYGNTPVISNVVDSGPYGEYDFVLTGSNNGNYIHTFSITNNGPQVNIGMTIIVGNPNLPVSFTAL